ncbi:DUF2254 domain-containing protein [Roseibium litorale]|uniref:DUF2254 domain-containing protein n=1 Tax=Roseibium litorale TaxID=2803841 RepID=A0ABR9CTZ6_9HYPH|nr:DUF2254 family protein [Roseibium litorale]MBD8894104.1 DUF2254 domain-containing protein [Roseibium litorale]
MKKLLNPVLSDHGFITVPGAVALVIWASSGIPLSIDYFGLLPWFGVPPFSDWLSYDTATSILSTIASAAMTTLSLVYSLVLVVFTLAAGTIAPRLLKRFTNDRVSQMTAGLLGGSFLFSLTILSCTGPKFVPYHSIGAAFVLAAISVLQLIYFVHSVSVSVMIDQEIAEIGAELKTRMARVVRSDKTSDDCEWPDERQFDVVITAEETGFISVPDVQELVACAQKHDILVELCIPPANFVTQGSDILRIRYQDRDLAETGEDEKPKRALAKSAENEKDDDIPTDADDETAESPEEEVSPRQKIERSIREKIHLDTVGGSEKDIIFAINLLLEIALRALSPGVNDTFTAIACTNRLSEVLREPVAKGLRENIHLDSNDSPRLRIPGLTLEELLKKSLQPLRLAAADNHLMLMNLAGMIQRLYAAARTDRVRHLLACHAEDVIATYEKTNPLNTDIDDLKNQLSGVRMKPQKDQDDEEN